MTNITSFSNITRSEGDPKVLRSGPSSRGVPDSLAKGLGWFSLGLGLTELLAPGRITRALGMEGKEALVRVYGAREIGSGILSLSVDKNVGLWSRVAGDGLDIATVLTALRPDNPKRGNVAVALALLVGITAVDLIDAQTSTARHSRAVGRKRSYRDRSGFPRGVQASRGAARDFKTPSDLRHAPALAAVSKKTTAA
ncbi:hypothetical protein ABID82_006241 [Methylobacterium sp. PvP062]|jgi:hypothetical protein|uniref:hypothetical protein n=1 Tax=Methylobacterium TaxID=407 RepID=UPI0003F89162|nr:MULTISPECIES: hypothetical protein [Methylobacterium]MCX7333856.1 hypothetical protein [Hyphomicrobiales bacterium]KZC01588.1 hypothetical protein AU375_02117 [Methylobacterium radiotolerans]MBY0251680.1 hypothetical protein [Methylobacterium organophilum]MDE3748899.1 hypothetical protein [Methylobacterium radiotolerans]PVY96202.1 hypothetical protein C7388_1205 [Methylobacterium organophilum]